jgi:hypothetical protein
VRDDPFAIKSKPKWHPARLMYTAGMRLQDRRARLNFHQYLIPEKNRPDATESPILEWKETAVVAPQMSHLLVGLRDTEQFADTVVVEIGSFRGITTRCLAEHTRRKLVAVDPFTGYGGGEEDFVRFQGTIADLPNVTHLRKTSGEAFFCWNLGKVSFVFIDATHDYPNTSFDLEAWSALLVPGGIVALHDTDNLAFPGTRRAVFERMGDFELYAHVENLVMLSNSGKP